MICTFICCSRGLPDGLLRAIESIYYTAQYPDQVEVLIRMDDDDLLSVNAWRDTHYKLCRSISHNIQADFGPRERGYGSLKDFTIALAKKSSGQWMCMFNDDAVLKDTGTGPAWDEQLRSLPLEGIIVQPEIYQLNDSMYPFCARSAFPFFPNNSWKQFGLDFWNDYEVDEVLRVQNRWKTYFLKGITIWHDRHGEKPA